MGWVKMSRESNPSAGNNERWGWVLDEVKFEGYVGLITPSISQATQKVLQDHVEQRYPLPHIPYCDTHNPGIQ